MSLLQAYLSVLKILNLHQGMNCRYIEWALYEGTIEFSSSLIKIHKNNRYIRQMMKARINCIIFYTVCSVYMNCFKYDSQLCVNIFYFAIYLPVYEYRNVAQYLNFSLKVVKQLGDDLCYWHKLLPLFI
jgi:hypothetical protein